MWLGLVLALTQQPDPDVFDLLIRSGSLVDGAGASARRADVGIRGDRIVAIGDLAARRARRTLDATGLVVAPGFIDMHSHSDFALLVDGRALSKVTQGVATELSHQLSVGVRWLAVNGELVLDEGKHTGARPGRVLRKPSGGAKVR